MREIEWKRERERERDFLLHFSGENLLGEIESNEENNQG